MLWKAPYCIRLLATMIFSATEEKQLLNYCVRQAASWGSSLKWFAMHRHVILIYAQYILISPPTPTVLLSVAFMSWVLAFFAFWGWGSLVTFRCSLLWGAGARWQGHSEGFRKSKDRGRHKRLHTNALAGTPRGPRYDDTPNLLLFELSRPQA